VRHINCQAPGAATVRKTAEYLDMRWGGALLGNGSKPDDVLNDTEALCDADTFLRDNGSRA
jgi:hypothetical protein